MSRDSNSRQCFPGHISEDVERADTPAPEPPAPGRKCHGCGWTFTAPHECLGKA